MTSFANQLLRIVPMPLKEPTMERLDADTVSARTGSSGDANERDPPSLRVKDCGR